MADDYKYDVALSNTSEGISRIAFPQTSINRVPDRLITNQI